MGVPREGEEEGKCGGLQEGDEKGGRESLPVRSDQELGWRVYYSLSMH